LLKENLAEPFFTIDGQSLATGVICSESSPGIRSRIRIRRRSPANASASRSRSTTHPPAVSAAGQPVVSGGRARIVFEAQDSGSYLIRAEYSVNGGDWQTVYSDDGISDSPRERYTIELPLPGAGEDAVTLRVFDANGTPAMRAF
jgi:hypothetical protein